MPPASVRWRDAASWRLKLCALASPGESLCVNIIFIGQSQAIQREEDHLSRSTARSEGGEADGSTEEKIFVLEHGWFQPSSAISKQAHWLPRGGAEPDQRSGPGPCLSRPAPPHTLFRLF